MKKTITKALIAIFIIGAAVTLIFNFVTQVFRDTRDFRRLSAEHFQQLDSMLEQREREVKYVKEDFEVSCMRRAVTAAYIYEQNPVLVENQSECSTIASLLQVDELHVFNPEGVIYAGTNPEYYGLGMDDGEQIGFFAPMLKNRSLTLCQDITPNTAEGKNMQYAAAWSRDGSAIIQVGLNPKRVLEAIKGNTISDILALVSTDADTSFYAVDMETNEIIGTTDADCMGKKAEEIGLDTDAAAEEVTYDYRKFNGKEQYCAMQKNGSVILVKSCPVTKLHKDIIGYTLRLAFYYLCLCGMMMWACSMLVDRKIIRSILNINQKLVKIGEGDWNTVVSEDSEQEFAELSNHINSMVGSLLGFSKKVSAALELSEMPIGICDYASKFNKLMATSRVKDILMLSEEEYADFIKHPEYTAENMDVFFKREEELGSNIYSLIKYPNHFIRKESFIYDKGRMVVLIDITRDIEEKQGLAIERDTDQLTGLYNRRAFYRQMDRLFADDAPRSDGFMVMFDLDHLKMVNDAFGHIDGDRYLVAFADALKSCAIEDKIASRLGGDEFVLFVHGLDGENETGQIMAMLNEFRDHRKVLRENGEEMLLEFSMGSVFCARTETDYQELLKEADRRMYVEKNRRKQKAALLNP